MKYFFLRKKNPNKQPNIFLTSTRVRVAAPEKATTKLRPTRESNEANPACRRRASDMHDNLATDTGRSWLIHLNIFLLQTPGNNKKHITHIKEIYHKNLGIVRRRTCCGIPCTGEMAILLMYEKRC